jgi:hypothetical protein
MKNFALLCFLIFSFGAFSQVNPSSTYVNGYYKKDGTYVQGYYKTTPNKTINDNYSTSPNVNPYTGQQGTIQPTTTPTYTYNTTPTYTYTAPTYTYTAPTYTYTTPK